ncbi:MAG TPA: ATP-dependent DNA ligase [Vitreimonas sp.]|uniref:ATP-dependent DNA ligase n=1 Tax=Vitreimonas sp. TaxID=3069702 RepID=UPI002D5866D3|nr:ATP-dependent DNA ligase [Vitreimonas sp.]HYD86873.1 ATP-dependent DNA ligase [Vitreimonas sp.]
MAGFPLPLDTAPMEARLTEELPTDPGWQFEPKWDGFRCLAFKSGKDVDLRAKSGKPLARYFPDVVERVRAMPGKSFVVDGELVIAAEGGFSFEALQLRLHPAASRVAKLAAAQPAQLLLFDCLADARRTLLDKPLIERRAALEKLYRDTSGIRLSPYTRDLRVARTWLKRTGRALDGVIAKRLDGAYIQGERAMLKVKRLRTADCVVGGFRYASGSRLVGSLLLGLYDDDGLLHHVGFSSAIANADRAPLTKRLEAIAGGAGFTGRAPGSPSRWSTERSTEWTPLAPKLVVEVRYDHVTDNRFRHGVSVLRWRPDKKPSQCTFDQLESPAPPMEVQRLLRSA